MSKQNFVVRLPSLFTVVVCVDGTLYGFCDVHGESEKELKQHFEDIRKDITVHGDESFYVALWADEHSQSRLQSELNEATDAIRFDF